MAIYIKGVAMPTSCYSCPFENGGDCYGGKHKHIMDVDDDEELFRNSRHPNCPLVYIPEPHGRLIDADELYSYIIKKITEDGIAYYSTDNAPTVIEGSE